MSTVAQAAPTPTGRSGLAYHLRVLRVIAGVEFKLKYAGSALGYVWSLAKPLSYFAVEAHPEAANRLGAARRRGVARHLAFAAIYEHGRGHRVRAGLYALRAAVLNPAGAVRYTRWRLGRRRARA